MKPINTALIKDLLNQLDKEEISTSRMAEILNEKAKDYYTKIPGDTENDLHRAILQNVLRLKPETQLKLANDILSRNTTQNNKAMTTKERLIETILLTIPLVSVSFLSVGI